MNIVAHMTKCSANSTVASARVARFLVHTLGDYTEISLVDDSASAEDAVMINGSIEHLFIVNGPMAFCDFLPALADLVRRARRVVWVQQDYTLFPPSPNSKAESPFRKVFADLALRPIYWTTVRKNLLTPYDQYVNWNQLTYDPQPLRDLPREPVLMYYGAYREKREPMFKKYLADAPYPVHVSTTTLRGKKFKALDDNIRIVPPFSDLGSVPMGMATLYIEDPLSSREFHSPANRFYEMLSAGLPLFFDQSSLAMLAQAGIHPKASWVVNSKEDLRRAMQCMNLYDMRREQRQLWHKDYVSQLRNEVLAAWEALQR